jgi:hypothetical protein
MPAKIQNPYRPGGPLHKGDLFVGRKKELDQIVAAYKKNQSVSIYGERRIGKTSLLYQLRDELTSQNPDAKIEYLTFEVIPNMDNFYNRLAALLGLEQWSLAMDFEPALQQQPVILLLDEFDRALRDEDFTPDFFSILRGWDVQDWIYLVVSTQKPLSYYAGQGSVTSPFGNTFLSLELGDLESDEATSLLQPLDKLAKTWTSGWEQTALELTDEQPWRLQLFGYHSFHLLVNRAAATFQEAADLYQDVISREEPASEARGSQTTEFESDREPGAGKTGGAALKATRFPVMPVIAIALLVLFGSALGVVGGTAQSPFLAFGGLLLMGLAFLGILTHLQ